MTQTKLESYLQIRKEFLGMIGQQREILELLHEGDFTRNEIAERSGLRINVVCARVNELLKEGYVAVNGTRIDPHTKMSNEVLQYGNI